MLSRCLAVLSWFQARWPRHRWHICRRRCRTDSKTWNFNLLDHLKKFPENSHTIQFAMRLFTRWWRSVCLLENKKKKENKKSREGEFSNSTLAFGLHKIYIFPCEFSICSDHGVTILFRSVCLGAKLYLAPFLDAMEAIDFDFQSNEY